MFFLEYIKFFLHEERLDLFYSTQLSDVNIVLYAKQNNDSVN